MDDLTEALVATGATLAFDAIGGGKLAGQILDVHGSGAQPTRQGVQPLRLDHAQAGLHLRRPRHRRRPSSARSFGMAWGVGGWLLTPFLEKVGPERAQKLRSASPPS